MTACAGSGGLAAQVPPVQMFSLVECEGESSRTSAGTGWDAEIIRDYHAVRGGHERAHLGIAGYLLGPSV